MRARHSPQAESASPHTRALRPFAPLRSHPIPRMGPAPRQNPSASRGPHPPRCLRFPALGARHTSSFRSNKPRGNGLPCRPSRPFPARRARESARASLRSVSLLRLSQISLSAAGDTPSSANRASEFPNRRPSSLACRIRFPFYRPATRASSFPRRKRAPATSRGIRRWECCRKYCAPHERAHPSQRCRPYETSPTLAAQSPGLCKHLLLRSSYPTLAFASGRSASRMCRSDWR